MREHLYRGKRKDNGEWAEGFYFYQRESATDRRVYFIVTNNGFGFSWNEVIPETLCEFTGLTDKNGNKIFEGDIIKCHYETYTKQWDEIYEVIYFNSSFGLKTFNDKHFVAFGLSTHRTCEILGNIFDNPELLNGKK